MSRSPCSMITAMSFVRNVSLLLLILSPLGAQTLSTGAFLGMVRDPTGASVPGVSVRVFNEGTDLQRAATTDAEGNFRLLDLPVGNYRLELEKSGFRKVVRAGVALSAGQSLRIDTDLPLGSVAETVQVDAKVAQVDTNTANVGNTVFGSQVQEHALATRSFSTLVTLQPGVNSNESQQPGVGDGLSFQINGATSSSNNWLLDGGRNVDVFNGNNQTMVNLDAIAEVRIERNAYSAEYGRNGGGQINVITRSGSNTIHGSLFEFFRNDQLDARNFFAAAKPKNRYNNYGGTVGGPIKRDKLFVFLSNEYRVIRRGTTRTAIVPTDAQISGNFTGGRVIRDALTGAAFPNNLIPASRIDPNALVLLRRYYPRPTPNFQQGALNFTSAAPDATDYRSGLGKLDYNIAPALTFSGHYNIDSSRTTQPFGASDIPLIAGVGSAKIFYTAAGTLNWSARPNLLNEFTMAYYHGSLGINTMPSAARAADLLVPRYFNTVTDSSGFVPSIGLSQGYASIQITQQQNISHDTFELIDHVSYIRNSHTFQFGGNYDRETKTQNNNNPNNNGSFAFNSSATGDALADLLLGQVFQYTESSTHATGTAMFNDFGWYAQDRWQPNTRLTLTYGVRYEFFQPERDLNGTMSYFDPARFNPAKAANVQANGQIVAGTENFLNGIVVVGKDAPYGYALTNSVRNSFAPRVGLSYSATKDNLTVVRAGYGMFHDRWPVYASQARRNYPFNQSVSIFNTTLSNPAQGSLRVFPASVVNFSSPWDIPYLQKWSAGVQRQLPAEFLLDVGYVGSRGLHFARSIDTNQPRPSAIVASGQVSPNAVRPYPGFASFSTYVTDGSTNYQSLQVSAVKRFSGSFSIQAAYTWSKTMDNLIAPPNAYADSRLDWGLSGADRTHVLVSSYVWELPLARSASGWRRAALRGWQMAGISSFQSGNPLTVTIVPDRAGVGSGGQRPNLLGSVERTGTIARWFNTEVFALPAPGTFGNAGRGLVRGPGISNFDVSFSKRIALTERVSLQFRGELFNLFNHTQFSGVGTSVGSGTFGQVVSARDPRIVQFGLRIAY